MRASFLIVLSTLLFVAPLHAGPKALFDNTHAENVSNANWIIDDQQPVPSPAQSGITWASAETYWQGAISAWGVQLVKRGYTVATLTTTYGITYGNGGNPYDLSNYDVFIVDEPNTRFSSAESTAIFNYVRDGGGLVAISDHDISDRNNDGFDSPRIWDHLDSKWLLFGAHFDTTGNPNNNISQSSANFDTALDDSIIRGAAGTVTSPGIAYHNGTTMILHPAANPSVRANIWITGNAHDTTNVMVGQSVYGNGRTAYAGDSSPCDDGTASNSATVFNGWGGENGGNDSLIFLNATLWATRRTGGDATPPTVTVSSPNGGEVWAVGSSHNITWSASDNVGVTSVDLAYSTNNGTSWTSIATGLGNTGGYSWTVPTTTSTQALVRATVRDAANNTASDASNGTFTIADQTSPSIVLTSPNGGETWACGSFHTITWSASDNLGVTAVDLEYSTNNGTSWTSIFSGLSNSGSFGWIVPNAPSTQALVRATAHDAAGNTTSDPSNATFVIADQTAPAAAVTSPNGGETWAVGSAHDITWTASDNVGVASVDLAYSTDNGGSWSNIALALTNSGIYSWTVPARATAQALVRVTARDAAGNSTSDSSNAVFTINDQGAPSITVTSPNGGESWATGSQQQITWTATDDVGVTAVDLDYSTNNGSSWINIAGGIANSGSFSWPVPATPTAQALVRATAHDAAAHSSSDASDAVFSITDPVPPSVTVTSPNGGESWIQGSSHTITWSASDNVGVDSVDVDYSLHGGDGPWVAIQHGLANTGSVSWTVPNQPSDSALVRVTAFDPSLNSAADSSDSLFHLVPDPAAVGDAPGAHGPARLSLSRPQPNPSRADVRLLFSLAVHGSARIEIQDVQGRRVWDWTGQGLQPGSHEIVWNGRLGSGVPAPAGMYYLRLRDARGGIRAARLLRLP